jgi:branched-chain amino acid transport system substrate-binding protein
VLTLARRSPWLLGMAILSVTALVGGCADEEEVGESTPGATEVGEQVPGVTDTEIKLGTHFALSASPAAAYAPITDGMRTYFDYINDVEGGVHGRKIKMLIGDDHYNPPDTAEVVRKLVEQDEVFAIVGGLGDATHSAVWKYLEQKGVPDMAISSGLTKWTDPVVRTRFGGNPDYVTEGQMLGQYIAENHNGKRLGLLLQNDEFGQEGETGLLLGLTGSDVEIVARELYEAVQFDVAAQTQRLKNADVDVIAAYALPPQAANLVKTAREVLDWDIPIIVTGVDCSDIFIQLAGAENAEGVVSVVFGHQVYETDHPGVKRHYEIMEKYGHGVPVSNFTLYGAAMAEVLVEALKNAGPDLTRDSFIDGTEAICDFMCSVCLTPISLSPTDHRPVEVEVYNRVEDGKWVTFGDPISFESTPDCSGE